MIQSKANTLFKIKFCLFLALTIGGFNNCFKSLFSNKSSDFARTKNKIYVDKKETIFTYFNHIQPMKIHPCLNRMS